MPDKETDKPAAVKPEEKPKYPTAKIHQKDEGHIAGTAFGEGIDGKIADIADGD
ncbi:MAG TPA: hypothetical protein VII63_04010 [Caulobacteraceae bacterium]